MDNGIGRKVVEGHNTGCPLGPDCPMEKFARATELAGKYALKIAGALDALHAGGLTPEMRRVWLRALSFASTRHGEACAKIREMQDEIDRLYAAKVELPDGWKN